MRSFRNGEVTRRHLNTEIKKKKTKNSNGDILDVFSLFSSALHVFQGLDMKEIINYISNCEIAIQQ